MSKKIMTPKAVLSYPRLDVPQLPPNAKEGADPQYSCTLLFAPGTDLSGLEAAALEAAVGKFGAGAAAKLKSGALKSPFRRDAEAKGYPEGSVFVNVRSTQKPGVVYLWADEKGKAAIVPDDKIKADLYAGAYVRATLAAFAYDKGVNKGVSFGLNNIQKLGDGPRLDGRTAAQEEFEADASMAPASIEELEKEAA